MRRKATMIGILALGLITTATHIGPSYCCVVNSARSFHQNLKVLGTEKTSLSPVERLIFSLLLTGTNRNQNSQHQEGAVPRRTS